MSLGKLTDAGHLGEEFKGMTIEQFLKKIEEMFYKAYGRYENASGKMYVEIEHNGADDNHEQGAVRWRKGITDGEVLEDVILERRQAIPRFAEVVHKGYYLVFNAVTPADFERENEKHRNTFSAMKREGLLGEYVRGEHESFRVNEYEGVYSVERLYDGSITAGRHGLSEADARAELEKARAEGFCRESDTLIQTSINPFAAWEQPKDIVGQGQDTESQPDVTTSEIDAGMEAMLKAFRGEA